MASVESVAAATSKAQKASVDVSNLAENALTLFITQLKYQDPTEPLKSESMMQSLASISEAGQTVQMNSNLEEIINLLGGGKNQFGSPVSYLGKDVEYKSSSFVVEEGEGEFYYNLEEQPKNVFVTIADDKGRVVYTTDGSKNIGKNKIVWDATDEVGNKLSDGDYNVIVSADYGDDSAPKPVETSTIGRVSQASFEEGEVVLRIGNMVVNQEGILSVFAEANETAKNNATNNEEGEG